MGALGWDCATVGVLSPFAGGQFDPGDVTIAVIHSAETSELQSSAEGVMNYFATGANASTHVTTDVDSIAASVPPWMKCWGVGEGNVNSFSVQAEQAGYASQDRSQWLDDYSRATITNTAVWGKNVRALFPAIRPVFLDAAALVRGERYGFTSHGECHKAWPRGAYRDDPGDSYPWDQFFKMLTDQPTDEDLGRLLEALAAIEERNMAKARLARAKNGDGTVYLVGATTKTAVEVKYEGHDPIAELKYADLVLTNPRPTGAFALAQDPNGVEVWRQETLDQFTTV